MSEVWHIIRRETAAFFSSPVAYLFIGTFLAVNLFVFFWADAFFARNIADVRPLFEWMPVLLVFLVAALTMRSWSEERRSGTLELLLTSPVSSARLVLGKFAAALFLVMVALALTLPLPFTVSMLGPLDWGPVIGGYAATLFLAGAYVAIGLFVSSRTDNQIVSLIVTVLIAAVLYLVGSDWLTALVGRDVAQVLRLIGTGSRFDSITRGVLDLRDIYYYLSLAGVFLALNVYSLEKLRWAGDSAGARRHGSWRLAVSLVVVNLLIANVWLEPISSARADLTQGNRYSISSATKLYLSRLKEPLLIRGYFSRKTHPLLAPLVPQLEDLLKEYAEAGGDNVRLQIVDPQKDPQAAREAKQRYGIKPVPFQTESRYESSVVSSYFNVLVQYGDQYKVLDFRDLVSVKGAARGNVSVQLNNPEYAITRAVRKVAYQWQGGGDPFAAIDSPVTFHGYISPKNELPPQLADLRSKLADMVDKLKSKSNGKLTVDFSDPRANGGELADRLRKKFGFRPMTTSLLDQKRFYFYIVLQQGGRSVPVPLPASLDAKDLRKAITSALQQFGQGFLKTVALYTPGNGSPYSRGPHFQTLQRTLRQNDAVEDTDLKSGHVPPGTDLLLV
ncbi:MAG TPA: Gldg family protein, partial [Gammaproteobacteria bacterium]|nr:Gldg family protein [Gammaproteobacteria bacterium]